MSRQASCFGGKAPNSPVAFFCSFRCNGMYLCYIDESGTSSIPGNTSHFVLAGLAIPIWHWSNCDENLNSIKQQYSLEGAEIHTAWLLRKYQEQKQIKEFDSLNHDQRRFEARKLRNSRLLQLQRGRNLKAYRQTQKNYRKTEAYIHLTYEERKRFISDIADCVSNWGFARLFAECIDKLYFNPDINIRSVDEQAFEQLVSRFEHFLQSIENPASNKNYGLLIHDNNETVATKHTELMQYFHSHGTLWTEIGRIIETPLFVNSKLTGLVQIADLCAYSLRRFLENQETWLFKKIFTRADRKNNVVVGIRHFSDSGCECQICVAHKGSKA